jgi:hypothetical protein
VRYKSYLIAQQDLQAAASAALNEFEALAEDRDLRDKYVTGFYTPHRVVQKVRDEFDRNYNDLSSRLGRAGSIPKIPSGLNYLYALMTSVNARLQQIGRLELHNIDLDLTRDRPYFKLKGLIDQQGDSDVLKAALLQCEVVEDVSNPRLEPGPNNRVEMSNLEVRLKPGLSPRPN